MKKWILLLLALMLLLTPLAAWAEGGDETPPPLPPEPEYEPLPDEYKSLTERVIGDWADVLSGLGAEPQKGQWEARDGQLFLDGGEEAAITPVNGVLRFDALGMLFTREKPEGYVPGDLLSDVKEGSFDGYWKAQFVALGEGTVLAQAVDEDAKLYIDGLKAALGGQRFGSVIRDLTLENGTLTLKEGDVTVTLALQNDGFLRMTLDGKEPATIYLMGLPVPERPADTP